MIQTGPTPPPPPPNPSWNPLHGRVPRGEKILVELPYRRGVQWAMSMPLGWGTMRRIGKHEYRDEMNLSVRRSLRECLEVLINGEMLMFLY